MVEEETARKAGTSVSGDQQSVNGSYYKTLVPYWFGFVLIKFSLAIGSICVSDS